MIKIEKKRGIGIEIGIGRGTDRQNRQTDRDRQRQRYLVLYKAGTYQTPPCRGWFSSPVLHPLRTAGWNCHKDVLLQSLS